MDYLSNYLLAMRVVHGKTQQYMANLVNKDQSYYSRMERGLEKVTVTDLAIIAKEFGLETHELMEMAKKPLFPSKK